jgi:hypothetical protein
VMNSPLCDTFYLLLRVFEIFEGRVELWKL